MARRYDSRTTIFSPEGRLYQVEYALESISHAGTVVGILAPGPSKATPPTAGAEGAEGEVEMKEEPTLTKKEEEDKAARELKYPKEKARAGIVLAAEKKVTSKLLEKEIGSSEKIFRINGNILAAAAGFTSDANSLVSYSRNSAQAHLSSYNSPMPVEQLVQSICDLKQGYTQFGGLRPFGVSFLFAGHDAHHDLQLYATDPSGNYAAWKATCVGAGSGTAQSLLRQDYRDDMGVDEAMGLALKVLSKTMDSTSLDSEKLEFAVLTLNDKGEPLLHVFRPQEIDALLEKEGLAKKTDEQLAAL